MRESGSWASRWAAHVEVLGGVDGAFLETLFFNQIKAKVHQLELVDVSLHRFFGGLQVIAQVLHGA